MATMPRWEWVEDSCEGPWKSRRMAINMAYHRPTQLQDECLDNQGTPDPRLEWRDHP